jgi:hypothetical protein
METKLKSSYEHLQVAKAFDQIIENNKYDNLKGWLEDVQQHGCISGMINEFIYHYDCKQFYIEHIDELEEMKESLEESIGEPIKNRYMVHHYTFLCWLCFEEYCYDLLNNNFED